MTEKYFRPWTLEKAKTHSVRSLRTDVREYLARNHFERNHRGFGNRLIVPKESGNETTGTVLLQLSTRRHSQLLLRRRCEIIPRSTSAEPFRTDVSFFDFELSNELVSLFAKGGAQSSMEKVMLRKADRFGRRVNSFYMQAEVLASERRCCGRTSFELWNSEAYS
jgi:hypothetical protein